MIWFWLTCRAKNCHRVGIPVGAGQLAGGVVCSPPSGPRNLAVCSPAFVAVMIEWSLDTMHFDTSRQPSLSLETTLAQRNIVIEGFGTLELFELRTAVQSPQGSEEAAVSGCRVSQNQINSSSEMLTFSEKHVFKSNA